MKFIRFSHHARERLQQRGATEDEVVEAIRSAAWETGQYGRWSCRKVFPFHREWNGKWYQEKEGNTIVVVTVYTRFFGKTEERG